MLKNFMILENEDGHLTLSLAMKPQSQDNIMLEDVAGLISAAMNIRLRAPGQAPLFMYKEWSTYYFRAFFSCADRVCESNKGNGEGIGR